MIAQIFIGLRRYFSKGCMLAASSIPFFTSMFSMTLEGTATVVAIPDESCEGSLQPLHIPATAVLLVG